MASSIDKVYCVYCHTTPSNRKYVGISSDPEKRWSNGKGYFYNYLFDRAIKKYGWDNIKHEVLYEDLTLEEAKSIERKLISDWDLTNPDCGLNLREGGDGNFSESVLKKMSEAQKGNKNSEGRILSAETKQKISNSLKEYYSTHEGTMKGKHLPADAVEKLKNRVITDETRERMRRGHDHVRGGKHPGARKVVQFDKEGNFLSVFDCIADAARFYHIDAPTITSCCRGYANSCGGFKWKYFEEVEN